MRHQAGISFNIPGSVPTTSSSSPLVMVLILFCVRITGNGHNRRRTFSSSAMAASLLRCGWNFWAVFTHMPFPFDFIGSERLHRDFTCDAIGLTIGEHHLFSTAPLGKASHNPRCKRKILITFKLAIHQGEWTTMTYHF